MTLRQYKPHGIWPFDFLCSQPFSNFYELNNLRNQNLSSRYYGVYRVIKQLICQDVHRFISRWPLMGLQNTKSHEVKIFEVEYQTHVSKLFWRLSVNCVYRISWYCSRLDINLYRLHRNQSLAGDVSYISWCGATLHFYTDAFLCSWPYIRDISRMEDDLSKR